MTKVQESCLGAGQTLFIEPLKEIKPLAHCLGSLRTDRTRRQDDRTRNPQRLVARMQPHVPILNIVHSIPTVTKRSALESTVDRTRHSTDRTLNHRESDQVQRGSKEDF
jgi:hypothetical protein